MVFPGAYLSFFLLELDDLSLTSVLVRILKMGMSFEELNPIGLVISRSQSLAMASRLAGSVSSLSLLSSLGYYYFRFGGWSGLVFAMRNSKN